MSKAGSVYCLSNPSFKKNIYKVGMTKHLNDPTQRLISLDCTSSPTPFKIEFYIKVTNRIKAEKILHEKLKMYRIRNSREYFKVDIKTLKEEFETIRGKLIDNVEIECLQENTFIVEKIKNHNKDLPVKETEYEVKWKGYKQTTWEPYKNLKHLPMLYEYILKKQL
jgi:hypothetical protein